jgi:hypothetical protein
MLDIIEIVHINQRLAYVYITIICQLNGNWSLICLFPRQNTSWTIKPAAEKILSDGTAKYRRARTESLEYLSELSTKWLNWYEHNSNLKYWTIKSVFELNFER